MTDQPMAGGTEGEGFPAEQLGTDEALGRKAVEDGAQAAGVTQDDLARMFAEITALQKRVAAQEAAAGQAAAGDAGKYAAALAAHLHTKSITAGTAEQAEHIGPALELADALKLHTSKDTEADPGQIPGLLDQLGRWARQHARRYPSDLAYITELADELADAHEADQTATAAA